MIDQLINLWLRGWRSAFEIILLSVGIYYGYLYFRGTRGAKVLTGLAIVFLTLTLISQLLNLVVIGWIIRSFSVFLAVALVRSEEHTSELQSLRHLVCRLLLEKKTI